jgi:hypothetical protein
MANGLIKKRLLVRRCNITDENAQNAARIGQRNISVDLEISLAAITNKNEFALGKVSHNLLQRAPFALGSRFKNALQHA